MCEWECHQRGRSVSLLLLFDLLWHIFSVTQSFSENDCGGSTTSVCASGTTLVRGAPVAVENCRQELSRRVDKSKCRQTTSGAVLSVSATTLSLSLLVRKTCSLSLIFFSLSRFFSLVIWLKERHRQRPQCCGPADLSLSFSLSLSHSLCRAAALSSLSAAVFVCVCVCMCEEWSCLVPCHCYRASTDGHLISWGTATEAITRWVAAPTAPAKFNTTNSDCYWPRSGALLSVTLSHTIYTQDFRTGQPTLKFNIFEFKLLVLYVF